MGFVRADLSNFYPLFYLLYVLLVVNCDVHAPCYSCVFYKLRHPTRDPPHHSADGACVYPCYCDVHILNCATGVKVIQDGCGCCNICSGQLGETCNRRFRCDEEQGLFCNFVSQQQTPGVVVNGTCAVPKQRSSQPNLVSTCSMDGFNRQCLRDDRECDGDESNTWLSLRPPKSCHVAGRDYEDGEQFKPNCSRLCTCRDGGYGCISLCPHEEQPPEGSCSHPQLTSVPGQCCREWTCDAVKPDGGKLPGKSDHLYATNNIAYNDSPNGKNLQFHPDVNSPTKLEDSLNKQAENLLAPENFIREESKCESNATAWSPCSVSCGIGVSVRMTTDLSTCQTVQQTQICYIRSCDQTELYNNVEMSDSECSTTVKSHRKQMIVYEGCHSSQPMHFRFCGHCGENLVCLPRKVKTIMMDFDCPDNKKRTINFMWIRKCHCIKTGSSR